MTKSVVSTLIGIAIADGLIAGLDQPLSELLPEHRRKMTPQVATVTLRDLLTMSGGFAPEMSDATEQQIIDGRLDLVDWAVSDGQQTAAGTRFLYSDISAHLAAAVLLSALQHNPATKGQSVLDYARVKLFDPLDILTRPAYQGLPNGTGFERSGFGWSQVGNLALVGFGLRLTAEDMAKIGQLYLDDGIWHGRRVLPEDWVRQATAPGETAGDYGLFWWRDTEWETPDVRSGGRPRPAHRRRSSATHGHRRAVRVQHQVRHGHRTRCPAGQRCDHPRTAVMPNRRAKTER
ncbi:serine hydrolase domain-containing protein [Microlunatus ginsengisoli]|uniref:Beta-lactamase-related domain-containing protein n=1 Tax=Microlunatus ginsengisoli TaxID=363863 RepID=A0ABP6ZA00_9ACTN